MAEDAPEESNAVSAAELMDRVLLWCQENRAERTFDWYKYHLQIFLDDLPDQSIQAVHLKPFNVYGAARKTWSATYKRGFMVAIQRAFTWGVKQGYLNDNPLRHLEKPTATRRDNCPTSDDYPAMLVHINDCFKEVIEFAWESGARPQEIFNLQTRHIKGDRVEFPVEESKGKKKKRIIYLNDKAQSIIAKHITTGSPDSFVFVKRRGGAWNPHSTANRFQRLAKKNG